MSNGNPFQQMQLVEQQVCRRHQILLQCPHTKLTTTGQDNYIQSRSTAIESIESTIAELGQIFTQLATMVAEQREQVQRIDADTVDIANNVQGAQRELLKYYTSISSNRWLMMKVFGVIIVFVSPLCQYWLTSIRDISLLPPATVPHFHPSFIDSLTFLVGFRYLQI